MAELVSSRELLYTLVERQLRLRAKRSLLGVAWPTIAPLFLLGLYAFVFQGVFHAPIERYPLYLFIGLLPWTFVAQSLGHAITSLSHDAELIRRTPFPQELLPMAAVISLAVYFLTTLVGLLIFLAVRGDLEYRILPMLLLPVGALLLFVTGIAMVLALIDVFNHDLRFLLGNLLTIWFFLVPIVYRPEMVGGALDILRYVDPANLIVAQFRDILFYHHLSSPSHVVLMVGICAGFFVACLAGFRRCSTQLAKDI
ncbi:MAG: ABC transporter permease [Candidatus Dormibacteria bacterium]